MSAMSKYFQVLTVAGCVALLTYAMTVAPAGVGRCVPESEAQKVCGAGGCSGKSQNRITRCSWVCISPCSKQKCGLCGCPQEYNTSGKKGYKQGTKACKNKCGTMPDWGGAGCYGSP